MFRLTPGPSSINGACRPFLLSLQEFFRFFLIREDVERESTELFNILAATVAVVLCRLGKVTLPVVQDALLWATHSRVWAKWEFERYERQALASGLAPLTTGKDGPDSLVALMHADRVGAAIIAAANIGAPAKCPLYKEAKRLFSHFPRPMCVLASEDV